MEVTLGDREKKKAPVYYLFRAMASNFYTQITSD